MKRCTGCGRTDDKPLGLNRDGEPFLACCPDNNYFEMTAMQELIKWAKTPAMAQTENKSIITKMEELLEKEKQQIIDATCLNNYLFVDDRKIGERYYKDTYKQD